MDFCVITSMIVWLHMLGNLGTNFAAMFSHFLCPFLSFVSTSLAILPVETIVSC